MRICSITTHAIADDARIRRQCDALVAAGHDVVAVGAPGGSSWTPDFEVVEVEGRRRSSAADVAYAIWMGSAGRTRMGAERVFWSFPENRRIHAAAQAAKADLYLANDWKTLPIASRAAAATGGRYAFDSQEWALEEFLEQRLWRLLFPRYIHHLQAAFIGGAAFVSTVCESLAEDIRIRYGLPSRPLVIRNVPPYQHEAFRPAGSPLVVLYHGQYLPNRGLETLVESVYLWPADRVLHLRGYASWRYKGVETRIRQKGADAEAEGRIVFHPRSPVDEIVNMAALADVGIHPMLSWNNQTRSTLPNKLFEYIMAGLALCVSDLPEMARVVREHDLGVLLPEVTPESIAETVAGLERAAVDEWKRHSLEAARGLCWEQEQKLLIQAVESIATNRH